MVIWIDVEYRGTHRDPVSLHQRDLFFLSKPPLWSELVCIITKDLFIVMCHPAINRYASLDSQ